MVIALEVMIFLAFCGLSFCGRKTSLSGRVFKVALSKCVHNCCVPHQAQASVSGAQSQAILPPSIVSQAHRLQGRGEPMRVNDLLRMELMAECLGKRPAFLVQERPWSPSSSDFGTSSKGDCNTELIGIEQVSNNGNWERFLPGSSVTLLCSK